MARAMCEDRNGVAFAGAPVSVISGGGYGGAGVMLVEDVGGGDDELNY